jgi:hypothetical protein
MFGDPWSKQPKRRVWEDGAVVVVRAWWTHPENKEVECRVLKGYPPHRDHDWMYEVRPTGGANPHSRYVDASRVLRALASAEPGAALQ